ncbi:MAG: hypothetical protein KTR31_01970 [Myxococcales bacterium]|nr:hypothetical protein [Myxococcales bacterium]
MSAMLVAAPALGSLLGAHGSQQLCSVAVPLLLRRATGLFWGWGSLGAALSLGRAWVDPTGSAASCVTACALLGLACAAAAWCAALIVDEPSSEPTGGAALPGLCHIG